MKDVKWHLTSHTNGLKDKLLRTTHKKLNVYYQQNVNEQKDDFNDVTSKPKQWTGPLIYA